MAVNCFSVRSKTVISKSWK